VLVRVQPPELFSITSVTQRIYYVYFAPGNAFITWAPAVPASWRSPGARELCMDADPAGSRDGEPARKITKT
jgi:hypothetical protein